MSRGNLQGSSHCTSKIIYGTHYVEFGVQVTLIHSG